MKDFFSALARLLKFVPTRLERHRIKALTFLREASARQQARKKGFSTVRALLALLFTGLLVLWAAGCSTLPPDIAALQAENARLRQALDECEADGHLCLELLSECEAFLTE